MARKRDWRAYGPYKEHRGRGVRWRIIISSPTGDRQNLYVKTEAEAWEAKEKAELEFLKLHSFDEALGEYEKYLERKGNKDRSIAATINRLYRWLPDKGSIGTYTERRAQARYDERVKATATDTHRNELMEVKTFFRWCVKKRWLPVSPVENIEPVGRRSRGKPQYHRWEAQQFSDACFKLYNSGERGFEAGLGLLLALWLGLRTGEIVSLQRRDLDPMPGDTWLWVAEDDGKTRNAKRRLEVPDELAEMLIKQMAVAKDRQSKWLFPSPANRSGHRGKTWLVVASKRVQDLAGLEHYVPPHGLRGTQSTLAMEAGASGHLVAKQLGHGDVRVTERHYLAPGTKGRAQTRRVVEVLKAGRKK